MSHSHTHLKCFRHEPIAAPPAVLRRGDAAHIWKALNTRGPKPFPGSFSAFHGIFAKVSVSIDV